MKRKTNAVGAGCIGLFLVMFLAIIVVLINYLNMTPRNMFFMVIPGIVKL